MLNVYLFLIANSVSGLAQKHVQVHASMSKSVYTNTHTHTIFGVWDDYKLVYL